MENFFFAMGGLLKEWNYSSLREQVSFLHQYYDNDAYLMSWALTIGMLGAGVSSPNPAVGCLIVDRKQACFGVTEEWGKRHAERVACAEAEQINICWEEAKVFVTLEPCSHHGKQPPCVDLLIQHRPKKVFIATLDCNPVVWGKGIELLRQHNINVHIGYRMREAILWHLPFFTQIRFQRPFVALKWAQTINGKLAEKTGNSQWISGSLSRKYVHFLRQKYDCIVVGAQTALHDYPRLNVRESLINELPPRNPIKIVVDLKNRIENATQEQKEHLCHTIFSGAPTLLLCSKLAKNSWLHDLEKQGILFVHEIADCICNNSNPLARALDEAFKNSLLTSILGRPLQSVLIEGGANLLSQCIAYGLGDVLHCFVGPCFLDASPYGVDPASNSQLDRTLRYIPVRCTTLEHDILIEYVHPQVMQLIEDVEKQNTQILTL